MADTPWIISADDHVIEPAHVWSARLSAKDREVGPRIVQDSCETTVDPATYLTSHKKGGNGPIADWWLYEDLAKPIPMVNACAGFSPAEFRAGPIRFDEMRPGCYDPTARLFDMDENTMERSLCFPNFPRFCGQVFLEAKDRELALRCVQAYNDWMIDEWTGSSGGRLIPLCIVPLWDPRLAAAEIERNAARGARAVTFSEMPSFLGLPSIHSPDRHWDPFFAACEATKTVICMHIGSGSRLVETSPHAPHLVDVTLTFSMAQLSFVEWLYSGVLLRFPKLKIAYSESQIGWMPYILERIDKVFFKSKAWAGDGVDFDVPPSSFVKGRVYGSFFDDEIGIKNRAEIGVRQILIEVDYPHQDTTWPYTNKLVDQIASQVTADELDAICRQNAIDMLGLSPEPLAGPASKKGAR